MLTFILLAVLIVIACLAMLLRPLLKVQKKQSLDRDTQNILFAKDRLDELEEQLANQKISQPEFSALKLEIETSLISDINLAKRDSQVESTARESNGVVIALLCTLVPFAALMVYQITGTPAALNSDNISNAQLIPDEQGMQELILGVEQRLQESPEDLQGWTILAQSYLVLGRYQDAIDANQMILRLAGESAAVYTQLADATALLAGGNLAGQPSEYVEKALAIDSQYPQALWLAGLSAAQRGDSQTANAHWTELLPLLSNSPEQQQELRDIIAQTSSPLTEEAPSDATDNSDSNNGLTVQVSLDASISSHVEATDSVFVFARAQTGPPAPLAVKRLTIADLPATVQLSDNDAMIEQFKLSLFKNVVVVARVSKSGNPIAQAGDIQSNEINSTNTTSDTIELLISDIVQ